MATGEDLRHGARRVGQHVSGLRTRTVYPDSAGARRLASVHRDAPAGVTRL